MTTTVNVACNAAEWTPLSNGHPFVRVELSKLGKGFIAVTSNGAAPAGTPDDDASPFRRIINREPFEEWPLGPTDKVWIWLPVGQTVGVDQGSVNPVAINQVTAGYDVSASFNRTADTVGYTAGDVVGNAGGAVRQFAGVGPSGGSVVITGVQLEIDRSDVPSGMSGYRLHLYNVTPPSALADNAPFDLPAGDRAAYLGFIDIDTPNDLGSTLYVEMNNIGKQVKLASTDLFGYLVTTGAFTPGSATPYKITLHTAAL